MTRPIIEENVAVLLQYYKMGMYYVGIISGNIFGMKKEKGRHFFVIESFFYSHRYCS